MQQLLMEKNDDVEIASGRGSAVKENRRGTFWRAQAFTAQTGTPGVQRTRKPLASGEFCARGRNVSWTLERGMVLAW